MAVTGGKSGENSKLAATKLARFVPKLGLDAGFTERNIQSIVDSCGVEFLIRLEGLASRHRNFASDEPELFPGLVYRMIWLKLVLSLS